MTLAVVCFLWLTLLASKQVPTRPLIFFGATCRSIMAHQESLSAPKNRLPRCQFSVSAPASSFKMRESSLKRQGPLRAPLISARYFCARNLFVLISRESNGAMKNEELKLEPEAEQRIQHERGTVCEDTDGPEFCQSAGCGSRGRAGGVCVIT